MEDYEKETIRKKKEISKKYSFDEELRSSFKILETMSWWIDQRKVMMLKFFVSHFMLLDEINKRCHYEDNFIRYATPHEISLLLQGKNIPTFVLKERKKGCVYSLDGSLKEEVIQGKKAKRIIGTYLDSLKSSTIKGLVASTGKGITKGTVSVVMNVQKDAFTPGTILVTSMTRPEFVPLMRKAIAIVTDEGGITCHAAIVSRELGIPCIIGTRSATQLLKTGDGISLNLKTGEVTKS